MTGLLSILLAGVLAVAPRLLVSKRWRTLRVLEHEAKVLAALREAEAPESAIEELSRAMYANARVYRGAVGRQQSNAVFVNQLVIAMAGALNLVLGIVLVSYKDRIADWLGFESTFGLTVGVWWLGITGLYFAVVGTVGMVTEVYEDSKLRVRYEDWRSGRRSRRG